MLIVNPATDVTSTYYFFCPPKELLINIFLFIVLLIYPLLQPNYTFAIVFYKPP